MILLPQPPSFWDHRYEPLHLAEYYLLNVGSQNVVDVKIETLTLFLKKMRTHWIIHVKIIFNFKSILGAAEGAQLLRAYTVLPGPTSGCSQL